jgi:hypothetical protein
MRLSLSVITIDSLSTPFNVYHKEVKRSFTQPFPKGRLSVKLRDLIKRIATLVVAPLAYPLTITLACVGKTLKTSKNVIYVIQANRLVRQGKYDQARQLVSKLSDETKNRVEKKIFDGYLPFSPIDHVPKSLAKAKECITHISNNESLKYSMYYSLVREYLQIHDYKNAFALDIEALESIEGRYLYSAIINIDRYIIVSEDLLAVSLINKLEMYEMEEFQVHRIQNEKERIFNLLINTNSNEENLDRGIDCLILFNVGEWRNEKIKSAVIIFIVMDQLDRALTLLDRVEGHKDVLKPYCAKIIAQKLLKDNEIVRAQEILEKYVSNKKEIQNILDEHVLNQNEAV